LVFTGTIGPGPPDFFVEMIFTASTDYFFFMNMQMQMNINKRATVPPMAMKMIAFVSRPSLLAIKAVLVLDALDVDPSAAAVEAPDPSAAVFEAPYVKTIEAHFMEAVSQS
jgi:hypothetical protein